MYEDGIVIGESGIEYWGVCLTGIRREPFSEIKSVELLPYYDVLIGVLTLRYGLSARRVPFNPFGKIVVIRLMNPNPIEYLFFAPKHATTLVEKLKRSMEIAASAPPSE